MPSFGHQPQSSTKSAETFRYDVSTIKSLPEYIKALGSRSVKVTMSSQIDRIFQAQGITVRTRTQDHVSWHYFSVILAHERRLYNIPRAFLVSCLRFLVIYLMTGTMDEYYCNGTLVAIASTVVKGDTLRAMWFYQRPSHSQCMIWFHGVRLSLLRAFAMKLNFVDLGPSLDTSVAELKAKFGFIHTNEWPTMCDYSGPFRYDVLEAVAEAASEGQVS